MVSDSHLVVKRSFHGHLADGADRWRGLPSTAPSASAGCPLLLLLRLDDFGCSLAEERFQFLDVLRLLLRRLAAGTKMTT